MENVTKFDAIIVGGGHNGLVAACYLAQAGLRVLILEKNETIGGATRSQQTFPGVDARVSVYSYLVSLLPPKSSPTWICILKRAAGRSHPIPRW